MINTLTLDMNDSLYVIIHTKDYLLHYLFIIYTLQNSILESQFSRFLYEHKIEKSLYIGMYITNSEEFFAY